MYLVLTPSEVGVSTIVSTPCAPAKSPVPLTIGCQQEPQTSDSGSSEANSAQ